MKREIAITADGSSTIFIPEWNESYHSKHGAIQEAYHVFIKNGFSLFEGKPISILEIGFGTGLNAFITLVVANRSKTKVNYTGVEAFPVLDSELNHLNYSNQFEKEFQHYFTEIHKTPWEQEEQITPGFCLTKNQMYFQDIDFENSFDLIYFDAFGYRVQPELWSVEIFAKMYKALKANGVLVTYACRTSIKNAMLEVGFGVEKLPGAPGKREMLRATKKV